MDYIDLMCGGDGLRRLSQGTLALIRWNGPGGQAVRESYAVDQLHCEKEQRPASVFTAAQVVGLADSGMRYFARQINFFEKTLHHFRVKRQLRRKHFQSD